MSMGKLPEQDAQRVLATTAEDAYGWLINYLRECKLKGRKPSVDPSGYHVDVAMPMTAGDYSITLGVSNSNDRQVNDHLANCMYDAIWELCRRGVLRPSFIRGWAQVLVTHSRNKV